MSELTEIELSEINEIDHQVLELKDKTYELIRLRSIALNNISKVTQVCMEVVENCKDLSGDQKKVMVQNVLKSLIDTHVPDDEQKNKLLKSTVDIVPDLIETFIDISKGEMDLNKTITVGKKLGKCILKCC